MGRKIPSKKHRGVKDPIEQQARRLQSLKGKINAPPKDPDEQPVPQSLVRLFAFQDKSGKHSARKNKNKNSQSTANTSRTGSNPIAQLKQLPEETGRSFSLRINGAVRALNDPVDQQDYPEDMEAEDVKGEHMAARRERRRRKRGERAPADAAPRPSRAQRLKAKAQAKKDATQEPQLEVRYERVSFGDVAHAPPALPLPRRAAAAPAAARPGQRPLLLSAMFPGAGAGGAAGADRERARLGVVEAYRALKRQARAAGKGTAGRGSGRH